jgi:hypothetical protein
MRTYIVDYVIEVQSETADCVALYSVYHRYDGAIDYQVPIAYRLPLESALNALRLAIQRDEEAK